MSPSALTRMPSCATTATRRACADASAIKTSCSPARSRTFNADDMSVAASAFRRDSRRILSKSTSRTVPRRRPPAFTTCSSGIFRSLRIAATEAIGTSSSTQSAPVSSTLPTDVASAVAATSSFAPQRIHAHPVRSLSISINFSHCRHTSKSTDSDLWYKTLAARLGASRPSERSRERARHETQAERRASCHALSSRTLRAEGVRRSVEREG